MENRTYPKDITYYCELCDAKCTPPSILPHLIGFKHYLYCLKEIDRDFYEYNKDRPKKEIIGKVRSILTTHERRFGRGKIRVIREILVDEKPFYNEPGPSWRSSHLVAPGYPMQEIKGEFDENNGASTPDFEQFLDTSKNDFHCTLCDVHMNNIQMWESHIIGKKHAKNLKKYPGATQSKPWSKPQTLKAPKHVSSTLKEKLKAYEDEVIVGLDFVRETRNENGALYNCFLCGAGCTSDIVDHLIGLRHRIKFLEKVDSTGQFPNAISSISQLEISLQARESLVLSECAKIEKEYGSGEVEVYLNKR